MNDLLTQKWSDIIEKFRKLDIIAGVDWDTTTNGEYLTNIYIFKDVKLKPLYYRTFDLEDMIEELETYYLVAVNKNQSQKFWDGLTSLWNTYKNAMVLLWSLIFWGCLGIVFYILALTPMGAKIIEMAQ